MRCCHARRRRVVRALFLIAAAAACGSTSTTTPTTPAQDVRRPRVLMLTATAGFRHEAIDTARLVMPGLVASTGAFTVTMTEDLEVLQAATLSTYDVLMFALTSGDLALRPDQKQALLDFVRGGGGFIGVHSATDTLYGWPEYGDMLGAYFKEHPWTRQATVIVENTTHPATAGLGASFAITDEFYTFRENPRPRVQTLLSLDAASVGATGDYPLAWVREYGRGRVYYNALGHFAATWSDPRFQRQISGAIAWAGAGAASGN
ncbi:MAG: ThuA domain-containing protein [Acidobacteria bacterium]|nr:ThuA domain-containing protein [Acidobacteriota bacterium]